jgi:hypothetical protein
MALVQAQQLLLGLAWERKGWRVYPLLHHCSLLQA